MQRPDGVNQSSIQYAAVGFGLEGVKVLLQAGCPLPDGGLPKLVSLLKQHPALCKVSVSGAGSVIRLPPMHKKPQPAHSLTALSHWQNSKWSTTHVGSLTAKQRPSLRSMLVPVWA